MFDNNRHYTKNLIFPQRFLQETGDFVTFTGEILNRKLHFLCSEK